MASYADTITRVRDWANRDAEALPDTVVEDCLQWAADKAYRTLRVPPLEQTYRPASLVVDTAQTLIRPVYSFAIPGDLIEFISIRELQGDNSNGYTRVFNEKADIRTFRDSYAEKYSDYAYWARERGNVLLSGYNINENTRLELYYYRRLPALDARFSVELSTLNSDTYSASNYSISNTAQDDHTEVVIAVFAAVAESGDDPALPMVTRFYTAGTSLAMVNANKPNARYADVTAVSTRFIQGNEVPHWLRDENERVILFGALAECFAYLQEDDQVAKYGDMFFREIEELNDEDQMRNASGGNVQVNFNGRGLI